MPITITTLNNDAAVAKTFVEVSKDRANAEWINSTDASATFDPRLSISQALAGKNKAGSQLRRTLVKYKITVPTSVPGVSEEAIVNVTITAPVVSTLITSAIVKDAVAYLRNFLTGANVDALRQGQV